MIGRGRHLTIMGPSRAVVLPLGYSAFRTKAHNRVFRTTIGVDALQESRGSLFAQQEQAMKRLAIALLMVALSATTGVLYARGGQGHGGGHGHSGGHAHSGGHGHGGIHAHGRGHVGSAGHAHSGAHAHGFRHRHGFAHRHFHGGAILGFGAFGYPWYYPYPGYYHPRAYAPPVVYIEQSQQQPYWYYCTSAGGYYPYVNECPTGWTLVLPHSPPR